MAYLNGLQIFVEEEEVTRGVEISSHPVEQGLELTDNISREPVTIRLSGEIVGARASVKIKLVTLWHHNGRLMKYTGRNTIDNAVIESFDTGHTIDIKGGCSFTMTLKEVRVAYPAYIPKNNATSKKSTKSGTQQVKRNTTITYHRVRAGDTLWGIAIKYYGDGRQFKKIYEANKGLIKDANKIYVGMPLVIPK